MSGGGGGGQSTNSTQVQSIPPWLEQSYQEAVDRARSVSQEEPPIYQGQRLTTFSDPSLQAFETAEAGVGRYDPVYNAGVANTAQSAAQFNADDFNQFMNPYTAQVTDEIARLGNRNFNENIMPGVNSQFTGNGMFGSSRNAQTLAREADKTQQGITGQQTAALQKGFMDSMGAYQTAQGRQLQAGQALTGQAKSGQEMLGTDVNLLRNVGQAQEDKQQLALDTAYNQFLEQRDAPKANTQWFSDIAHGINANNLVTSEKQTIAPAGNAIGNAIGTAGSLFQAQKGQSGSPAFAKGGLVKAKREVAKKKKKPMGIGGVAYA